VESGQRRRRCGGRGFGEGRRGGVLIAEKLGVSQPTASEHMKILLRAGLVRAKRIKQWTFYKRDETSIRKMKRMIMESV